MQIDGNEFVKEVTLRLCSSLNISEGLEKARNYMAQVLPVDGVFINFYEEELQVIRTIASVTSLTGRRENIITPLNDEALEYLGKDNSGFPSGRVRYLKHPSESIMGRLEGPRLGYVDRALIAVRLNIEGVHLGVFLASALPDTEFSPEQIALFDNLHKPFTIALLNALTHEKTISSNNRLTEDNRYLTRELSSCKEGRIVGSEGGLKDVMEMVNQVAPLNNSVLLLGETGVGKEIIANALHCLSPRKDGPLIKVNCGAIPEDLIDSELFGHEKGAFTGAGSLKRGRFERADGGTIFLDEIGELPPAAQVRLLRVLQTHEIERVGGTETIPVNIRVVAATHRNLEQMVIENQFREDLWFRLNVFPVVIPPLRHRLEDIPDLVEHFILKKSREMGLRTPPDIAEGAMEVLVQYDWRGNVRELENVVERALIQNRGRILAIDPLDFSSRLKTPSTELNDKDKCVFPCLGQQSCSGNAIHDSDGQFLTLDEVVARQIEEVLKLTKGKVNGPGGAADLLDLHPNTLRNRMDKLGVEYGKSLRR